MPTTGNTARLISDVRDLARRSSAREIRDWLEWLPKMPFEAMARHSMGFWLSSERPAAPGKPDFLSGGRVVLVSPKETWKRVNRS